jgi:hypothetical protein
MKRFWQYFLLGFVFWIIVDFTTTEAIRNPIHYYSTYMPALLLFYVGYPLVFSVLIHKFKIRDAWIFIATLIAAFIVEIIFTHNSLLYTFPIMFIAIPAAVGIYSLLTFLPKWIIEGKIKENKWRLIIIIIVWVFVFLASLFSK